MTHEEAAKKVNEALAKAKSTDAMHDTSVKSISVEIDGEVASLTFKHGTHALEHRRGEIHAFGVALIEELLAKAPSEKPPSLLQKAPPVPTAPAAKA